MHDVLKILLVEDAPDHGESVRREMDRANLATEWSQARTFRAWKAATVRRLGACSMGARGWL
jgi:hypothetical protein